MHELALCQALVAQVDALARERAAHAVRVWLGIGPLSGAEPRALGSAYPLAARGTRAEDAELVLETTPVQVACRSCGARSEAAPNRLLCARCGDWRTTLLSGDELLLLRVELADVAVPAAPAPPLCKETPHV